LTVVDGLSKLLAERFAHAPRPDPRDYTELAEAAKEVPRNSDGVAPTIRVDEDNRVANSHCGHDLVHEHW